MIVMTTTGNMIKVAMFINDIHRDTLSLIALCQKEKCFKIRNDYSNGKDFMIL